MQKILVIQQKMIGDVLLSTILCEALKKKYPSAVVHYLVNTSTISVVEGNPFVDTIIEFKKEYKTEKGLFYQFLKEIKKKNYTIVVDSYGKIESNLITLFSGATEKISFAKWYTKFIYTKTVKMQGAVLTNAGNALENRLRLVYEENEIAENIIAPKIYLTEKEKKEAKNYLELNHIDSDKPLIMIGVLGSSLNKTLPFECMAKLIDTIVSKSGATILFNYIPNQEDDARKIYGLTKIETQSKIKFSVYGKSLRQFIGILSHCDVLVGNEGGAVNMAKAIDVPTFTVFSPWIEKKAWNMFEDGMKHDSVHLEDFEPNLYTSGDYKSLKEKVEILYLKMTPERIIPILQKYLANHN